MKSFIPRKTEKEVISIRINSDTLNAVDKKAVEYDMSRNEFINQCIEFALNNISK